MDDTQEIKSFSIEKQILFTWFTLFIQFSLTTVDFIFLERISHLATVGVASIIPFTYMVQHIATLFSQSMVTNASYYDSKLNTEFSNIVFLSFFLTLSIIFVITIILFLFKDYLLNILNISQEARYFASIYVLHIIPFFIVFAVQQYFSYIFYALGYAMYNFIYFIVIMLLNVIFNFVSLRVLNLGLPGIIWSSTLSIMCVLPIYLIISYNKNINIQLSLVSKETYLKVLTGFKNLGAVSIIEPIAIASLRFIIVWIVAFLGEELVSAKRHASNFLTICLALSISIAVIMQAYIARLYGEKKLDKIKSFYSKYLYRGLLCNILLSSFILVFIYFTIDFYSDNAVVKKYIIISLAVGIFIEAMRALSIMSRAHIKGLQSANIPFICSFLIKALIICPLFYLVIKYTSWGIIAILLIEGLSNFLNFFTYSYLIKRKT